MRAHIGGQHKSTLHQRLARQDLSVSCSCQSATTPSSEQYVTLLIDALADRCLDPITVAALAPARTAKLLWLLLLLRFQRLSNNLNNSHCPQACDATSTIAAAAVAVASPD